MKNVLKTITLSILIVGTIQPMGGLFERFKAKFGPKNQVNLNKLQNELKTAEKDRDNALKNSPDRSYVEGLRKYSSVCDERIPSYASNLRGKKYLESLLRWYGINEMVFYAKKRGSIKDMRHGLDNAFGDIFCTSSMCEQARIKTYNELYRSFIGSKQEKRFNKFCAKVDFTNY